MVKKRFLAVSEDGSIVSEEPLTVKSIEKREGKDWVLFEETDTGYPLEQVRSVKAKEAETNLEKRITKLDAKAKKLGFRNAEQANLQFKKAGETAEGKKLLKDYSSLVSDIKNLSITKLNDIVRDNLNSTVVKVA